MNLQIIDNLKKIYDDHNFAFFEKGDYNLNIFGIRADTSKADSWDDLICCAYKKHGTWRFLSYQATTDPGKHWLVNPMKKAGTAILCEGQHRRMLGLGKHRGRYEALVQIASVPVFRDNNRDVILNFDPNTIEKGKFGINLHRASALDYTFWFVGKWSAACQVIKHADNFNEFMAICTIAAKRWGNSFTYTLFNEKAFNIRVVE